MAKTKTTKKPVSATETTNDQKISKAKRVRDYMEEYPKARNVDIAKALHQYGVKESDVSNAKTQMKKKKKRRGKVGRPKAAANGNGPLKRGPKPAASKEGSVSFAEFQSALSFAQSVGGFARGRQVLEVVEQIKQL